MYKFINGPSRIPLSFVIAHEAPGLNATNRARAKPDDMKRPPPSTLLQPYCTPLLLQLDVLQKQVAAKPAAAQAHHNHELKNNVL